MIKQNFNIIVIVTLLFLFPLFFLSVESLMEEKNHSKRKITSPDENFLPKENFSLDDQNSASNVTVEVFQENHCTSKLQEYSTKSGTCKSTPKLNFQVNCSHRLFKLQCEDHTCSHCESMTTFTNGTCHPIQLGEKSLVRYFRITCDSNSSPDQSSDSSLSSRVSSDSSSSSSSFKEKLVKDLAGEYDVGGYSCVPGICFCFKGNMKITYLSSDSIRIDNPSIPRGFDRDVKVFQVIGGTVFFTLGGRVISFEKLNDGTLYIMNHSFDCHYVGVQVSSSSSSSSFSSNEFKSNSNNAKPSFYLLSLTLCFLYYMIHVIIM